MIVLLSGTPYASQKKVQPEKKKVISLTSDVSRAEAALSLAAKQEPSSEVRQNAPDKSRPAVSQSLVAKQESELPITKIAPISPRSDVATAPKTVVDSDQSSTNTRLARVTAYWADEGDYYTERGMSATGVRLHDGHCAVDPSIIPYGSVVEIAGVGKYLAVDTGSAVISRTAAREGGHTYEERHAIVIDVFFEDASDGERFAARDAKFVSVTWYAPTAMNTEARAARSLFADENWSKIQSKQL